MLLKLRGSHTPAAASSASDEESKGEGRSNEKGEVGSQNADSSPPVPKKPRRNDHRRIGQRSVGGYGESQPDEEASNPTHPPSTENPPHYSSIFDPVTPYFPPQNSFYPQPMMMSGYFHPLYMPYQYSYPYGPPSFTEHAESNEAERISKESQDQESPRKSDKAMAAPESPIADAPKPKSQSTPNESYTLGWGSPAGYPPSLPHPPMTDHPFNPMMRGGMMMYPPPAAFMFGARPIPPVPGVPLFLEVDQERLSDYQIAIRKQLEFFEASHEDVESNTQGRKKAIKIGQGNLIADTSVTPMYCRRRLTAGSR